MRGHYDIRICNAVLVGASMLLSGRFGWQIMGGEDGGLFALCMGLVCAVVAYLVSMFAQDVGRAWKDRQLASFVIKSGMLALAIAFNVVSDYTTASMFRDEVLVATNNTNTVATNAREELNRIDKTIADLRAETAWRTKFEAPETYDALINKQKQIVDRGANVWQRTQECRDTTLPVSSRVCQRIADLEATKANAQRRQEILSELKTLGEQREMAVKEVATQKMVSNAALTQVRSIAAWFTLERKPDDRIDWWGAKAIMLYMTILLQAIVTYLGFVLASIVPRDQPAPIVKRTSRWLSAPASHEPIELKAEDWPGPTPGSSGSSITVTSKNTTRPGYDRPEIQRLIREIQEDFGDILKH